MSDNLSTMLAEFRASSAPDSITPESLGFLLQAIRAEAVRLVADAASGGEVDLSPLTTHIDSLQSALNSYVARLSTAENNLTTASGNITTLTENISSLSSTLQELQNLIEDATISVQAPGLLPFYGIVNGVEIKQASCSGKWRAVYDGVSKQFLAQALPLNYTDGMILYPDACAYYLGNVGLYNSNQRARYDLVYIMGNNLYAFVDDSLTKMTDNP